VKAIFFNVKPEFYLHETNFFLSNFSPWILKFHCADPMINYDDTMIN